MREVGLFTEDSFHEDFLEALTQRFSRDYGISVRLRPYSVRGGITKMHFELEQFLRDLKNDRQHPPDTILIARDANCQGYLEIKQAMARVVERFQEFESLIIYAIPDPHIERWMLVDPNAFQRVFGLGCDLPRYKCERGRYKKLLIEAIRSAGIQAALGGREYAVDIIREMDLAYAEQNESSLEKLLKDLKRLFNRWSEG
jgi:hypothetical protein